MATRGRRERPRVAQRRVRVLLSPLADRDYRLIWGAQLASTVGDWATRLALAVVVLHRTGSATMASLVVAASLVAWLGPGQLLSQFADIYGRRLVMVVSDVLRAAVFLVLALPVPTWALLVGAAVAGLAGPPFAAARAAATRELVPVEHYGPAMALAALTVDAGTVLGYALGGAILAVASPEGALMLNAATFAFSAVLVARLPETHVRPDGSYRTRHGPARRRRRGLRATAGPDRRDRRHARRCLGSGHRGPGRGLQRSRPARPRLGARGAAGGGRGQQLCGHRGAAQFRSAEPAAAVGRAHVLIGAVVAAGGFLSGSHVGR